MFTAVVSIQKAKWYWRSTCGLDTPLASHILVQCLVVITRRPESETYSSTFVHMGMTNSIDAMSNIVVIPQFALAAWINTCAGTLARNRCDVMRRGVGTLRLRMSTWSPTCERTWLWRVKLVNEFTTIIKHDHQPADVVVNVWDTRCVAAVGLLLTVNEIWKHLYACLW